jgi:hypothetical protein
MPIITRYDQFWQLKKDQLQHDDIRNENQHSITTRYDQFWQLKVNYNMLRSVLTITGQLQEVAISSDN